MDELLRETAEGVLVVDPDGRVVEGNPAAEDLLDLTGDRFVGAAADTVLPAAVGGPDRPFVDGGPPSKTVEFEEYYPELEAWLAVRMVPIESGTAVYLRDVTEHRERERELRAREDEIATLERINDVVRKLLDSLVEQSERERIETEVCERLVDSPLFSAAWIAEPATRGDGLRRRAVAGNADPVVEALLEEAETDGLEGRAAATGDIQVSRDLAEVDALPTAVRRVAFAEGLQSGIAVPLSYGDALYGVLGAYTDRPVAFEEGERVGFRTLGEATGLAINAARQRRLLLTDSVVELTLSVGGENPFSTAASEADCTLRGAGMAPVGDAALLCFLVVEGADPETAAAELAADGLVDPTVVEEYEDGGLVRVRLTGDDTLSPIVDHGGTVTSMTFEAGGGELLVETNPGSASDVLEVVRESFPGTRLVSKRERERDADTPGGFRSEVRDRLTERQNEVLLAAFLGGYYDWPRGSTAEEVAESLDIASATLHNHLRKAEHTLLDSFFDDRTQDTDRVEE